MKRMKSVELSGDSLLAAVAQAIRQSYSDLATQVSGMTLAQLRGYLRKHPFVSLKQGVNVSDAEQLRHAILASHELLPCDGDLADASQDHLWPLCESLLERYDISLVPRMEVATYRKVWLADDDNLRITGATAREAILRFYVVTKLGAEVTLEE